MDEVARLDVKKLEVMLVVAERKEEVGRDREAVTWRSWKHIQAKPLRVGFLAKGSLSAAPGFGIRTRSFDLND